MGLSVAGAVHEEGDVSLDVCREVLHGREELRSGGDVDGATCPSISCPLEHVLVVYRQRYLLAQVVSE